MSSFDVSVVLQLSQYDLPFTTVLSVENLSIRTFKKLPKSVPNMNNKK